MNKYVGETFLSRIYRDMHNEESVIKSSNVNDSKYERIKKYLDRLEKIHTNLFEKDRLNLIKKYYYDKYVVKKENISDDYFKYLEENALNRGFGHIKNSKAVIDREKETIINDQKRSLDVWIDYFCSQDSKMFPIWFKYYVFQSVVKLGKFDKEKNCYNQRTEKTISIFPELNREALGIMYDYFYNFLNKKEYNVKDKELDNLIKGNSFKKIYAYLIRKLSLANKLEVKSNEGVWVKYEQGSDPTLLVKSIEGKGTGWCTAGFATAKEQLESGDFYIFYSYDSEGKATIPRIGIRMDYGSIAEVRGVLEHQNIEPEMMSVVDNKLKEFYNGDLYNKKTDDMNRLTLIYKKYENNIELNKDDLKFLYEIDNDIQGFGYLSDPRINEIKESRNKRRDLSIIFGCGIDKIVLKTDGYKEDDLLNGSIVYFEDDISFFDFNIDNIKLPTYVDGSLYIDKLENVHNIVLPSYVKEDLFLMNLKSMNDIILPKYIGGYLNLSSLVTIDGLVLPDNFDLNNLIINNDLKEELLNKKNIKTV